MSKVVSIRLTDEVIARYTELAAAQLPRPLSLTTYLKKRLEEGDNVLDELYELRRQVEELANRLDDGIGGHGAGAAVPGTPADRSLALEAVLLLRTLLPLNKVTPVHKEIERQKLPVWNGAE